VTATIPTLRDMTAPDGAHTWFGGRRQPRGPRRPPTVLVVLLRELAAGHDSHDFAARLGVDRSEVIRALNGSRRVGRAMIIGLFRAFPEREADLAAALRAEPQSPQAPVAVPPNIDALRAAERETLAAVAASWVEYKRLSAECSRLRRLLRDLPLAAEVDWDVGPPVNGHAPRVPA